MLAARQEQNYYRDGELLVRMALWDKKLSDRHRTWGSKIQCSDIDQVVTLYPYKEDASMTAVESLYGEGYAFVEYKHMKELRGDWRRRRRSQIDTLRWIADKCEVPLFFTFYDRVHWTFFVVPMNEYAVLWTEAYGCEEEGQWFSEQQWVYLLYRLRGLEPRMKFLKKLERFVYEDGYRGVS